MSASDSGASPMAGHADEYPRTWVVDGANVIGSRADGWWRDRPGAARRLVTEISAWLATSVTAPAPSGQEKRPARIVVVLEGAARAGVPAGNVAITRPPPSTAHGVELGASAERGARTGRGNGGEHSQGGDTELHVVHAPGHGDDAIVHAAADAGRGTLVISSDRGLVARVRALGADTRGARWLRERLET